MADPGIYERVKDGSRRRISPAATRGGHPGHAGLAAIHGVLAWQIEGAGSVAVLHGYLNENKDALELLWMHAEWLWRDLCRLTRLRRTEIRSIEYRNKGLVE
jgi:hypothetical protein